MGIVNTVIISFYVLTIFDIASNDCKNITILFDIGFSVTLGLHSLPYMLGIIMLAKVCNPHTRGTIFYFLNLIGSLVIMIFQGVAGNLYSDASKQWPFMLGCGFICFVQCVTMTLGFLGKI